MGKCAEQIAGFQTRDFIWSHDLIQSRSNLHLKCTSGVHEVHEVHQTTHKMYPGERDYPVVSSRSLHLYVPAKLDLQLTRLTSRWVGAGGNVGSWEHASPGVISLVYTYGLVRAPGRIGGRSRLTVRNRHADGAEHARRRVKYFPYRQLLIGSLIPRDEQHTELILYPCGCVCRFSHRVPMRLGSLK